MHSIFQWNNLNATTVMTYHALKLVLLEICNKKVYFKDKQVSTMRSAFIA